ncbi:uncharacterized protein LOC119967862 [Scyliorhinus canicula]|uniref:uncharacterized protein LOC119967862 n=1 Tax=Scyliorhinus canicula TaxID=7830 RepID=UPI0018F60BAC|nr:uncharacterized protein LOC119967862 [Scyliorhinus canicula]
MLQSRYRNAPRFSEASLHVLLQGVRERQEVLYPADRKKRSSRLTKVAWTEIAAEVTRCGLQQRDCVQCRKRMNDLLRSARDKKAYNNIEMLKMGTEVPYFRNLTRAEAQALELAGDQGGFCISDVETGVKSIKCLRAVEGYRDAANNVSLASSEEGSAHTSEDAASNLSPFLSTSRGTITPVGKPMLPDSQYGEHLNVMQVQLMGAVKDEVPESPPDFGGQAHSERQADDDGPLMSATLSLLELQQRAGESLAELPKAISGHARIMKESLQDMSLVIGRSCERMASAMERLASTMESQIQQNTQCLLGVSANLQTVALAVSSLQPNGRHMVHLDAPPSEAPPPSTESREMPSCMVSLEELQPGTPGGSHRDGLRVDRSSPAPLSATNRLQRKRPQKRPLD